jgi:carboxyl-terminal processing protease
MRDDPRRTLTRGSDPSTMRSVGSYATLRGFALGVVVTLAVVGGLRSAEATQSHRLSRDVFGRAIGDVLDRYVDPIDESDALARGLRGIVDGLDPHSHYLTASERRALRGRRGHGSVGCAAVLHRSGGKRWLDVVAVLPGSPAEAAGLRPGDHILAIGDVAVGDLENQHQVDALLAGPLGEDVELEVQRSKDPGPSQVRVEFADRPAKLVSSRLVAASTGKVAVIRIRAFAGGTGEETKRTLASLRRSAGRSGLAAIVLDVRANPGGQVDEALVVADLFVSGGVLTRTRGRGGKILREERAHAAGTDADTPLVVLQDRHTASAAELLAVALRDHGRAQLVGERTYGKGTVQQIVGLEDGSAIALTIARYHSPEDHGIDGVGVGPHVHVALEAGDDDGALRAALDTLGLQQRR